MEQVSRTDDEQDPLFDAAHALVGAFTANKAMATAFFLDWLIRRGCGQKLIKNFTVHGNVLYSCASEAAGEDAVGEAAKSLGRLST